MPALARGRQLLRRWWRRTLRRLRRARRATTQAVTPLGRFVAAVALAGLTAGIASGWIEGWFVAVLGALLLLLGLPFLAGARSYRAGLELSRANAVVGGNVEVGVIVENTSARPQLPSVAELPVGDALREVTVPLLGPRQTVELAVGVPALQRGVVAVGPLTVARRDPLGLLRRDLTWPDRHLLHVHPRTAMLPPGSAGLVRDLEGQSSRRLTDSDLSFHAVRDYVPGDAVRHIHWRSTAKTGSLMVRQFEESQTARVAVLFDARREEYGSDEEFELGVSVAASISVQAAREGRERFVASAWAPGRVRPSIDGLEELPSRSPHELLDAWAELDPAVEGLPIDALARNLADSGRALSIVALVTGSLPEAVRLRRAALAFPSDVHVLGIRCEVLAEPRIAWTSPVTLATVGELGDLPRLMTRRIR
ncbi:DUF58 domain-containing protein [Leucobacter weissii]|uniref:DUF58 domain-containing protein n=2 Tax=Leucobacter weissii TaxID=1983706 RepID=A0A939S937_9MICO|nr:DUF58 domain-containing protein [Leucobacter weissii]